MRFGRQSRGLPLGEGILEIEDSKLVGGCGDQGIGRDVRDREHWDRRRPRRRGRSAIGHGFRVVRGQHLTGESLVHPGGDLLADLPLGREALERDAVANASSIVLATKSTVALTRAGMWRLRG
jgi:hypothetical protein